jgi:aminoglycoside 6-adenylyltransferase
MRSEKEMLDLILHVAENDDNIRAVIMNGSRVNPHAKKDPFQDFDIVYFVRDVEPYKRNKTFISPFGDLMIMQTPEDMIDPPAENDGHYTYLMQFLDGNRIDLSLYSLDTIQSNIADSLTVVLLDKDHLIPSCRFQVTMIIFPKNQLPNYLTIAATNFGGSAPTLPRDYGETS